jgi:hypothetical protein
MGNCITLSRVTQTHIQTTVTSIEFGVGHSGDLTACSEILKAVLVRTATFRNVAPCSPVEVNRRFGGIFDIRLQH